jgi:hypothetical protein
MTSKLTTCVELKSLQCKAAWSNELKDRVAAYERGEAQLYSAEEVFTEAKHHAKLSTALKSKGKS